MAAVGAAKGEVIARVFREVLLRFDGALDFDGEGVLPVGDGVHLEAF